MSRFWHPASFYLLNPFSRNTPVYNKSLKELKKHRLRRERNKRASIVFAVSDFNSHMTDEVKDFLIEIKLTAGAVK